MCACSGYRGRRGKERGTGEEKGDRAREESDRERERELREREIESVRDRDTEEKRFFRKSRQ